MKIVSKRSILNLALFLMLLAGLPIASATPWGWLLLGVPLAVWGLTFLVFIHKSLWAALVFWAIVALFHWQLVVVGLIVGLTGWLLFLAVRQTLHNKGGRAQESISAFIANPATGAPMAEHELGIGIDAGGNSVADDWIRK